MEIPIRVMQKKTSVLFEMSVLGYAANGAAYRTGVFRMVENWLRGLVLRPDLDLNFTSLLDTRTALRSLHYLEQANLERLFLPQLPAGNVLASIDHLYLQLARQKDVPLVQKILRRALQKGLEAWEKRTALDIAATAKGEGIFHSTYWPFPESIRKQSKRRFLMTFVDLINLVNQDLSTDGGDFFRHVLSTVHSEDFTVSISEATRNDLLNVRTDLDPARSFVVPLAASDSFRPILDKQELQLRLSKWSLRPDEYILSVGTLERRKNLPMLLDAFDKWASTVRDEDTKLVLTGAHGNALDAIQARLSSSRMRERVLILGFVDDKELAPLYQGARVFAYPSLHEGFGLPVLEALQCGAIVVTSKNSSLPEVAGDAAIYCDAKDLDSIVDALTRATALDSEKSLAREKATQQASQFSWEKSVEKLTRIYKAME